MYINIGNAALDLSMVVTIYNDNKYCTILKKKNLAEDIESKKLTLEKDN